MKLSFIIKNVAVSLVFALVFIQCYISFLNYYFDYAGFTLYQRDTLFLISSVIISLFPVLFYRGFKSVSSFISIFIYILLYVPIVLTFALGSNLQIGQIFLVQIIFAISMVILFLADLVTLKKSFQTKRMSLVKSVLFLTIIASVYLLIIYRSNLKLVSFGDVYEQRSSNSEIGNDAFTGYFSSWLTSFMIPICLAYGIVAKKKLYFIVGSIACLVLYMSTAAKGTIMLPFIYLAFNILFSKNRIKNIYVIFVLSITIATGSMLFFNELNMVSSILLARTVGNGGYLTMWYYDFFLTHPNTYYSHINIVNLFTQAYPYDTGLGFTVGKFYWSDDMNANANFWATDGIAALGLFGVLFISVISYFILMVMNLITKGYNKVFVILCFIPFIGSLLNTSIFSSLLSGGGFFVLLFFFFHSEKGDNDCLKLN